MLKKNFWKKKLDEFNKEEWEALCDRCGKCCLIKLEDEDNGDMFYTCLLYTSPSPRDLYRSRMPSSA